ncbi:hypothetical protein BC628DRAFT_1011089 [Trametes gibbosa]|nr:hypothetical protein BC628DRAFT_1011089 [Trametes gibbosa]
MNNVVQRYRIMPPPRPASLARSLLLLCVRPCLLHTVPALTYTLLMHLDYVDSDFSGSIPTSPVRVYALSSRVRTGIRPHEAQAPAAAHV